MKTENLKKRLDRNRPMTSVTLRMPEDVVEDLKRIAPLLGFSGYQPLMRAYVGQCLRKDLERLDTDAISNLVSGLKRRGVRQELIEEALAEATRAQRRAHVTERLDAVYGKEESRLDPVLAALQTASLPSEEW